MRPSAANPAAYLARNGWRLPVSAMSSWRVRRTRTGRRVFQAPSAAMAAHGVGLHFLAAEGAAHAQALDGDLVARQPEHARDDVLRLGRMLRGRSAASTRRSRRSTRWTPASRDRSAPGRRSPARRRRAARSRRCAGHVAARRPSGSVRKLPASIACSIVRMAGSGSYSTCTRAAPRRAASSVSPSTHATGWPWNITSRGKSGSSWRLEPESPSPGTSAPVRTS